MIPIVSFLALALSAQPISCQPVDPATMVWTGHGYSIAMGDGHLTVHQRDVKFWNGPQPIVCLPGWRGMMRLYLPKHWPIYAKPHNAYNAQPAHGIYAWIADHNYKAIDGTHCCGISDCFEINPADAIEKRDGFHYQDRIIDKRAVYQSRDGKAWLCRFNKCLFLPGGG